MRLAQSISPSEYKPLQKQAPQKGPLKNISPWASFQNFTVFTLRGFTKKNLGIFAHFHFGQQ